MLLSPSSLLRTQGYDHPFRISQVFKRYDGEPVGLTTIWPFLKTFRSQRITSGDYSESVGIALAQNWGDIYLDPDDHEDDNLSYSPGILTMAFEISSPIDLEFNCNGLSTIPFQRAMGSTALVDGRKIGTITHYTDDIRMQTSGPKLRAFPLLRMERNDDDLENDAIRNGALVRDEKNQLLGIIVNRFDHGRSYSVAPVEDVMSFHGLELPTKDDIVTWNSEREEIQEYIGKEYQERFYQGASVDELDPSSQQVRTVKGQIYAIG